MSNELIKNIKEMFVNPNAFHVTGENLNFPFQCYFVGGRLENIKEVILPALKKELGMNLVMIGHKDPTKKSYPTIPFTAMLVIHLKDMSSHPIREWAKKETDDMGIPFIEIVQKIKPSLEIIQKHYPLFWNISQRFLMLRSILPAEDCKQEDDFFVFTIENFVKEIISKPDWKEIEEQILNRPYKSVPVNVLNEPQPDFYRETIKSSINDFLKNVEIKNQDGSPTKKPNLDNPRVEDWYISGSNILADHVLKVIQGKIPAYTKEQLLQSKRNWLYDMITDNTLDQEWTKTFHKVDLAFKAVFGCGIPSVLKIDVKDMLDMKYQDLAKSLLDQETPALIETQPAIIEEGSSILDTLLISDDESPKEEIMQEQKEVKPNELKSVLLNGMKFQMSAGASLVIENVTITDLDLKDCSHVSLKNVNGNHIGEMKITF